MDDKKNETSKNITKEEKGIVCNENNTNLEKNHSKKGRKIVFGVIILLLVCFLAIGGYFVYQFLNPTLHDVTVELGTDNVTLDQFLVAPINSDKVTLLTDFSTIDFSTVGTHEIELEYDGRKRKVNLSIIDTTAPQVEFQNISKYIDYKFNADDFIKNKSDLSEMTTSVINPPTIDKIGVYPVTVEVKDASGNVTSQICELNVSRVVKEYTLELGTKLKKENILLNKADKNAIKQSDIDNINKKGIGTYKLACEIDGDKETVTIHVKDTTSPKLKLKNVTIYDDETVSGKSAFIQSCSDASKVTTTLKSNINYSKIGTQDIVIEAVDAVGNKTEKTAKLTIRKDTVGPVFSGLKNISVRRGASVNFKKGVKAVDAKDGSVSFTVDTSKVNLKAAGTYFAKYTAKDKKGNTTTKSRRVTVNHNQEDTNNKFNSFYNNNLAGKSISGVVSTIRSKIKYNSNWGGDDPVWYGLTNNTGNCYVHAVLVQKALNKMGIKNQLIYTTDKTHYWNLVYSGGKWRHYDATPTKHIAGPATDKEKASSEAMRGRKWSSSFPKAE